MNNKKICFIACVNNDEYEQEMIRYISNLYIPDGYELDYLSIRDAASMCAGYNEGMNASDAKYKVYLHQDTFIVDPYFLINMLRVFEDETVGMMGLVGSEKLPDDGVMWHGKRIGEVYFSTYYKSGVNMRGKVDSVTDVEAVDGFLIATQIDISWREDLFTKWDFYDISQSAEMRRAGYKVVIPNQDTPWCMHDDAFMNLCNYEAGRKTFLNEYKGGYIGETPAVDCFDESYEDKCKVINELLGGKTNEQANKKADSLTAENAYNQICSYIDDEKWFVPVRETDEFAVMFNAVQIYREEIENENLKYDHIFTRCQNISDVKKLFFELRMIFYRMIFVNDPKAEGEFIDWWNKYPSIYMIWKVLSNMVPSPEKAAVNVTEAFLENGYQAEAVKMGAFLQFLAGNKR